MDGTQAFSPLVDQPMYGKLRAKKVRVFVLSVVLTFHPNSVPPPLRLLPNGVQC